MTTEDQIDEVTNRLLDLIRAGASVSQVSAEGACLTRGWDAGARAKYEDTIGGFLIHCQRCKADVATLALNPHDLEATKRRACLLGKAGRFDEALVTFDRALDLYPESAECHFDRGTCLWELNRPEEALLAKERAASIAGDSPWLQMQRSPLLLLLGNYRQGWKFYEQRRALPEYTGRDILYQKPQWDGKPFYGRTLLIHHEGGLGDVLQFYRFVAIAMRSGGRVILEVPNPLVLLLASQAGAPSVVPLGQVRAHIDLQCSIMSLPYLLDTQMDTTPSDPYLCPLRAHPPVNDCPSIGINWAGSQWNLPLIYRTMPLQAMLDATENLTHVVSLQKEIPSEDYAVFKRATHVLDLGSQFCDFSDTAAVINQLDLVISVDTSVAHLAAAMGKPVWVLLPHKPDWRWLARGETTPWYPTARLFRQDKRGDWSGVVARVREALECGHWT